MRRLILLRHAKAETDNPGGDHARRLTDRGRADAGRIGRALAARALNPELALVSTAARAVETWAEVAPAMPATRLETARTLYNAGAEALLEAAQDSGADSVMVVAHNPGLHELAVILAQQHLDFPPAAVAAFDIEGRKATLAAHLTPKTLPPVRVYKILSVADWETAKAAGQFEGSADDRRDGFIHLSASDQVKGTAEKHFAGRTDLVLVCFDAETLGPALRWEPSRGGALFPHLYAPLPAAAALEAGPLPP